MEIKSSKKYKTQRHRTREKRLTVLTELSTQLGALDEQLEYNNLMDYERTHKLETHQVISLVKNKREYLYQQAASDLGVSIYSIKSYLTDLRFKMMQSFTQEMYDIVNSTYLSI